MASSGAKWVGVFLLVALTSCAGLTTAETHTNAGVVLHEDGQYERAIAEYDEAIRLDPAFALAYYNRGVAYARLQEFERAVADYDASIRLDPQREEAFNGRAVAYDALGEQALSAEDYQEAARLSRLPRIADDESGLVDEVLRTAVDFLSSYGPRVLAAVATGLVGAAAIVGSLRLLRWIDRPMLKATARLAYLHDLQGSDRVPKLFLEARNPHSNTVTVQSLGLEMAHGEHPLLPLTAQAGYVFPYAVTKGSSIIEWADVSTVLQMLETRGKTPSDLKWLWFSTPSGERHRARIDRKVLKGMSDLLEATTMLEKSIERQRSPG